MKTISQLSAILSIRNLFLPSVFLLLLGPVVEAQEQSAIKGYDKAVYNGLQDNVYLTRWLVLGPMPITGRNGETPGNEILKKAFDNDLFINIPVDKRKSLADVEYEGKKYAWKYVGSSDETMQLNKILGDTSFVFCYALAEIVAEEPSKLLIGLGSDDAAKVWVNGSLVFKNFIDRALVPDDDIFEISLNKGSNQILVKIQNSRLDYGFTLRPLRGDAIAALLCRACETGDFDNIRMLTRYAPDFNNPDRTGLTPWQLATLNGYPDISQFLEEQGASKSKPFPSLNAYLDSMFSPVIRKGLAPGAAILVSQGGEILLKKAYGFADIGNRIPVTTVTKFRIGSITKQFIAAAILKLQEEGKISVTDKLSKFIPDFPRGEEVTIHHLLTHTSGIPSFTSQEGFLRLAVIHATEEEMLDTIKSDQYDFNPGEKFSYNNSGYYLLGTIIGKITGKFYGDYLREVFFGPLGMKNTGVHASNLILDNEATGYAISNGIFEKALNWDMSRAGGAGSLYSTVEDLNLWNEAVFNGKVLNDSSLKAAFTVVTLNSGNKPDEMDYACGWVNSSVRGVRFISHGGGLHGFLSQLVRQPDEQLTVAVITNCTPAQDDLYPNIVADNIGKYLLWQKMGSQPSFFSDTSVSSVDLTEFEGRYDYGNAMVLIVTAEGNELYAQMTGQARFRIFPRGNDEFYWKVVDARIRFLRNEAGDITGAIHFQGGGEIKVRRLPPIMGIIIDSSRLEKYSGKYEYQPGVVITLTASEGKLLATVAGQNQLVFVPVSGTEFSCLEMNAFLKFIPLEGENFNLEVNLGGNIRTISKME